MKIRIITLLIALATLATMAGAAGPERVRITTQIYRIRGNVSGDATLTDDIWGGKPAMRQETRKAFSFFTEAKLNVAGHSLTADPSGWRWDGKARPAPAGEDEQSSGGVLLLSQPAAQVNVGQTAQIEISSDQALEYFAARGDGLYELRKMQQPTGLTLKMAVRKEEGGRIGLEPLTVGLRLVERRKPLAGTTLNVGEPVVSAWEYRAEIRLKPARDYGFLLFTSDGQGTLLVKLRVEPWNGAAN